MRRSSRRSAAGRREIGDKIGAVLDVGEPRVAHRGARSIGARVLDERADLFGCPRAIEPGQRVGVAKAVNGGDLAADDAIQMRSGSVGSVEPVAGLALPPEPLAR